MLGKTLSLGTLGSLRLCGGGLVEVAQSLRPLHLGPLGTLGNKVMNCRTGFGLFGGGGLNFSSFTLIATTAKVTGLCPMVAVPSRGFAARKGTRTRKEKKKVKKEEVKRTFVFKNIRRQMEMPYKKQRPWDKSHYPESVDDVYFEHRFQTKVWPFTEAIQNFRETHHPTVYNVPEAPLILRMNVDLSYPNRPNKFQDGWRSVIEMKEAFLLPGMSRPSVMAFCIEDNDYIADVLKAGADLAGSKELIKSIQAGEVDANDYEYIVSHPSIVPDLTVIRGIIKRKFPMVKNRTVSADLVAEIKRLKAGVKIRLEKNDREPDFGFFETPIGTINMPMESLEANFLAVLNDTVPRRVSGKTPEKFIVSCVLKTPDSGFEEFNVDMRSYLSSFTQSKKPSPAVDPTSVSVEEEQQKLSASQ